MEEILDVYTRDGTYIGKEKKSYCRSKENRGVYYKPAWIWIVNSKGEVLVQKRANQKRYYPNKWDMSSAGHVTAGEATIQGAVREIEEELGIKVLEKELIFITEYLYDDIFQLGQVYLLKKDIDISEMKLQTEEVSEVKWLKLEDFKQLFYSDLFVPLEEEYRKVVLEMLKNYIRI